MVSFSRRRNIAYLIAISLHALALVIGIGTAEKAPLNQKPVTVTEVELSAVPTVVPSEVQEPAPPEEMALPKRNSVQHEQKHIPKPQHSSPVLTEGTHESHTNTLGASALVPSSDLNAVVGTPAKPDDEHNPKPVYPESSQERNEQGVVLLQVVVEASGDVTDAELAKSSGFEALDKSAIETVKKWKFTPATVKGQKVKSKVLIPVRFKLEE